MHMLVEVSSHGVVIYCCFMISYKMPGTCDFKKYYSLTSVFSVSQNKLEYSHLDETFWMGVIENGGGIFLCEVVCQVLSVHI